MDYTIILYIFFGILPSLIWLFYYLRKDTHPEPKRMIIKVFLWGAVITLPVFLIQIGLKHLLDQTSVSPLFHGFIYWFLIISLSEEIFKYLVIRVKVINNPVLDEPLDLMLYMVVAALGFTAVENILYLFAPIGQMPLDQLISRTLIIDFVRFIGATFLHTLCSAVVGYSLAVSFCEVKFKKLYFIGGIFTAVALHGIYNFSIITLGGYMKFAVPAAIILMLAFLVFSGFDDLKKKKGICKLK